MTTTTTTSQDARLAALTPARRELLMSWLVERAQGTRVPRQPRTGIGAHRFPVSPGQDRLLFLDQLDPGSVAYVVPIALRLLGPLDPDVLTTALGWLVERHEVLRTTYTETEDGVAEQIVHPPGTFPFTIDQQTIAATAVDNRVATLVQRPFDLTASPPLRANLLRVDNAAEHILLLCVHHIAVDGWSLDLLVRELGIAYGAIADGSTPALAPPVVQYADAAVWQRTETDTHAAELAYWRTQLAGSPTPSLPTEAGEWPLRGARVHSRLDPEQVRKLSSSARSAGCTVFTVLVAAVATALAKLTGHDEMVLCSPVAGRHVQDVHNTVGYFVNTIALRVRAAPHSSPQALLDHVADVCVSAFDHQDVPFDRVVDAVRRDGLVLAPEAMVSLRNVDPAVPMIPGVAAEVVEVAPGGAQLAVAIEFVPATDGGLGIVVEHAIDIVAPTAAARLIEDIETALRQLVQGMGEHR